MPTYVLSMHTYQYFLTQYPFNTYIFNQLVHIDVCNPPLRPNSVPLINASYATKEFHVLARNLPSQSLLMPPKKKGRALPRGGGQKKTTTTAVTNNKNNDKKFPSKVLNF